MKNHARALLATTAAALLCLLPTGARADRAIVVGINQYPGLKDANLDGCVNDAQAMADALRRYQFDVTLLTDEKATHAGILAALRGAKETIKPEERFVFYFAGHGANQRAPGASFKDARSYLLLHDSQESSFASDLPGGELREAVRQIPARMRSIILDSCFSGGMVRSKAVGRKTRFHARIIGGGSKDLVECNNADQNRVVAGDVMAGSTPDLCYFTASRDNEQAAEDEFGAKHYGVFTHFLVARLQGAPAMWGDVQKDVSAAVSDHVSDNQHPTLLPGFHDKALFDNRPAPGAPSNVWTEINADNPDPERLQVTFHVRKAELAGKPSPTAVTVDEDLFSFKARAGREGYLVLYARGPTGNLQVIFPKSRKVEDARVQAGKTFRLPADEARSIKADQVGTERIRGILFSKPGTAEKFLGAFPEPSQPGGFPTLDMKKARDLLLAQPAEKGEFFTSDFIFEVLKPGDS